MDWYERLELAAGHPITLIAIGSAVGGNLRYWIGRWIEARQWPGDLPWGTIVINVSGSLLIGFFAVWFLERLEPARRGLYLLLGTGLCGGYTTFSTFEWENYKLIRDGNWLAAMANVGISVAAGFLALLAGVYIAHLLFGKR
jgi:CrcB protein